MNIKKELKDMYERYCIDLLQEETEEQWEDRERDGTHSQLFQDAVLLYLDDLY